MRGKVVFFDLETGGLDPAVAVNLDEAGWPEVEAFECKVRFDLANAEPEALAHNSYDADVWANEAVAPLNARYMFTNFLKRHATVRRISRRGSPYYTAQTAGHNADRFDAEFLLQWYRRADEFCPAEFRVLDTFQLALWLWHFTPEANRPESVKLEHLAKHYEVGYGEGGAHDALADVRVNVAVARHLRADSAYGRFGERTDTDDPQPDAV